MGPWEAALGESFAQLHPRLRDYFRTIPRGAVGRGSGTFAVAGTPRRWLWPLLALLGSDGILFAAWERDVPFTVENRPVYAGLASTRTFSFAEAHRRMTDHVVLDARGLEDRLGRHGWVAARLEPTVVDGMLTLESTSVTLFGVPLPSFLRPRVTLTERIEGEQQHVSLTLDAPVVGRLYEYSGTFTYRIDTTGRNA